MPQPTNPGTISAWVRGYICSVGRWVLSVTQDNRGLLPDLRKKESNLTHSGLQIENTKVFLADGVSGRVAVLSSVVRHSRYQGYRACHQSSAKRVCKKAQET